MALAGTDLVRHKDKWAAGVKEMRDIFGRLESEGYTGDTQQVRIDGKESVSIVRENTESVKRTPLLNAAAHKSRTFWCVRRVFYCLL